MTKSRDRPMCGASRRSRRAHSAWNVEIHICRQSMPSSACDARAHLLRRLVGEGDGEDAIGLGDAAADEVGDAVRDDARLAGARAGEDQERAFRLEYSFVLFRIEAGEKIQASTVVGSRQSHPASCRPPAATYSTVTLFARFLG